MKDIVVFTGPQDLTALLDRAQAKQARESVRKDPKQALTLLEKGRATTTLTLRGQSRILDEIIGEIADGKEAERLLRETIPAEALAEIMAAGGDLPSTLTHVVDAETVLAALAISTGKEKGEDDFSSVTISLVLCAWAEKLKDRSDWQKILGKSLGGRTLRDYLIGAVCFNASTNNPSSDLFVEVGLEPDETIERLRELRSLGNLPRFSRRLVEQARARLRRRKQEFESADVVEAVQRTASDIDL